MKEDSHPHPDPDAEGLPSGAVLPDARAFRRGQLRAIFITNAVAFAIVLAWWLLDCGAVASLIALCAVSVMLVVTLVRYTMSR